jgi:hypothetical protein
MNLSEREFRSFIVKLWLEDASHGRLCGHITDVSSGERSYLKELDEITVYIVRHLEEAGWHVSWSWPVRRWLKRWKRF